MTAAPQQDTAPNVCHVCGFTGCGIGIGFTHSRDNDPRWLCADCSLLIEDIKKVKRLDAYELKARAGGMDAAGEFIEANGADLSAYTEEQALMLVGVIWKGCASRMRELLREGSAPF